MALAFDDVVGTATRPTAPRSARPGVGGRWRLPKRAHQVLLTVHVLASVGWFGLAGTVLFCALVGQSRDDVAFFEVVDATLALSIPLGLVSAASGVALSVTTRWGLARHWWVVPGPVYAHVVVLALATVLSIVKPKARTPLGA